MCANDFATMKYPLKCSSTKEGKNTAEAMYITMELYHDFGGREKV